MDARSTKLLTTVSCLTLLCVAGTGCTTLGKTSLWGSNAEVVKESAAINPGPAAPPGKFIVEMRTAGGKATAAEHSISGPINAHDALNQAKALKQFSRMKIELVRPLPSGGWHRMPLDYDRSIKRIAAESDYAILPGDRIIVTEDSSNILTDMLESASDGTFLTSPPKSGKTSQGTFRVAG
jgi:hypothetical protein